MAILRDTVVSVLHRAGRRTIAERLRCYRGDAFAALALLGIPLVENAYALPSRFFPRPVQRNRVYSR